MGRSRWGGFRKGWDRYTNFWSELRSEKAVTESIQAPATIEEFNYKNAQGIWNLNSTVNFRGTSGTGGGGGSTPSAPTLPSGVLLYTPFTGSNGATTASGYYLSGGSTVESSTLFTAEGGASISTSQSTFSGTSSSFYNPGTSIADGFILDSTVSNNIESAVRSIQFWFRPTNQASGNWARMISWGGYNDTGSGIEFECYSTTYNRINFYEYTSSAGSRRRLRDYNSLVTNTWTHIYWAWQPNGNSYVGVNGNVISYTSYLSSFAPQTQRLAMGKVDGQNDDALGGYYQELIVRSDIPYTSSFTPPTAPLL